MFSIFIVLFYKAILNQKNKYQINDLSMLYPTLVLFYNFSDPNFESYHQIWDQFENRRATFENEITCSVNCSLLSDVCKYYKVEKMPVLLIVWKKMQNFINFNVLSAKFLDETIESIVNKSLSSCPSFVKSLALYPAFVFSSRDYSGCAQLLQYKQLFPKLKNHFYFQNSSKIGIVTVYYNSHEKYETSLSNDKTKSIKEFSYFHFGNWTIHDVRNFKRRICVIVYDDNENNISDLISLYKPVADKFWKKYAFNTMSLSLFNSSFYVKMKPYDAPFIFISNEKKSRFGILKNIYDNRTVETALKRILIDPMYFKMEHSFEPLLPSSKFAERKLENVGYFALTAFSVIGLTAFLILMKASKCITLYGKQFYYD